jgi:hypothetical protein
VFSRVRMAGTRTIFDGSLNAQRSTVNPDRPDLRLET